MSEKSMVGTGRNSVGSKSPLLTGGNQGKASKSTDKVTKSGKPRESGDSSKNKKNDENLNWVKCDKCSRWVLYETTVLCAELGSFNDEKVTDVSFTCDYCELKQMVVELAAENKELRSKVADLEKKLDNEVRNVQKAVEETSLDKETKLKAIHVALESDKQEVKELVETAKSYSQALMNSGTAEQSVEITESKVTEGTLRKMVQKEWTRVRKDDEDEKRRINNFIIFRLPEATESEATDRQASDMAYVSDLLEKGMGLDKESVLVKKTYRLGKPKGGTERPRPLMVRMESESGKECVMRNLGKLKSAEPRYNMIRIAHDLTPEQRIALKEKIQQAKENIDNSDQNPVRTEGGRPTDVELSGNAQIRVVGPPGKMRVVIKKSRNI